MSAARPPSVLLAAAGPAQAAPITTPEVWRPASASRAPLSWPSRSAAWAGIGRVAGVASARPLGPAVVVGRRGGRS